MASVVNAERIHIGIFGSRNAGKSSLINRLTNQDIAIVSDTPGTTTDPVKKSMEMAPIGPVVIIDTPGIDDDGDLGKLRVKKTKQVLNYVDIAIVVLDFSKDVSEADTKLIDLIKEKKIPYLVVHNKVDLAGGIPEFMQAEIYTSAKDNEGIDHLREEIAKLVKSKEEKKILQGVVKEGDRVVLVIPIDSGAPKGRIILPQQLVLRELIDKKAIVTVVSPDTLEDALNNMKDKPNLVITDSQVFGIVNKIVPDDILLTSFSILFARYKGNLETLVSGVNGLDDLNDGSVVLISEGCSHHRQCEDIGTVKMPKWIKDYTGKNIIFEFTSGGEFPEDLSKYDLIVHCGGCMINEREMQYRLKHASDSNILITNYGMAIAKMHGILNRSLKPFKEMGSFIK